MAEPSTTTPPPAVDQTAALSAVRPDALHIVLFGLPAAGKSSLLGALAQAGQTQEHLLNGRLVARSEGLAELQKRLYVEHPRPTAEEVAPYPIEFDPFTQDGPTSGAGKFEAMLIDCDGRVANDLLARRRTLSDDSPEGTLAREVIEADTLILVVDAAAPAVQVDAEFAEFGRFLHLLERGRGQRSEVGGLPVFLVLTKCDLLAQQNDTSVDWMERVEERKRQVHRRFQDFLARQGRDQGPLPFGRIDLHLWATAVKRPALGPTPAKPREPYGVAELFRQCLEAARAYRQRERHSSHRLLWTVAGATGILGAMAVLTVGLIVGNSQERPLPLATKIDSYRSREGQTPSTRLREPLGSKIGELTDLKNDPEFARLPEEQQAFVAERLQELETYRGYRDKLQQVHAVSAARDDDDLRTIEESLEKVQPPPSYQKEWSQTEAVQAREQRLKDIGALRKAVEDAEDWYRRLRRDGDRLLRLPVEETGASKGWSAWYDQFKKLQETADNPRFRDEDMVPSAATVTYATVLRFKRVGEARSEWATVQRQLERARDMAAVLGLIGPLVERPALLVIPKSPDFTAQDARARVLDLRKAYPRARDEFSTADLPEQIGNSLRTAARTHYDKMLESGRVEVLKHLQAVSADGKETLEHWRELRTWLADPEDMAAWRILAGLLGRMQDAEWSDPLGALASFLTRDRFELDLRKLTLEVPFSLNLRPSGKLSLYHPATNSQRPALVFELGEPQTESERRVRIYPLRLEGTARTLAYRPGEKLWATLPVEYGGKGDWQLTWARGRSEVYQFDHLARAPQLHQKDQDNAKGEVVQGVTLSVAQGMPLPAVPDLMPVVKLEVR